MIALPDLLSPSSAWDWIRVLDVLLCFVLVGMSVEILARYWKLYRHPPISTRAGHVVAISTSYLIFVALLGYANLFQIGRASAVERVTAPMCLVGALVGIVGLYSMLRTLSGKSDRPGS